MHLLTEKPVQNSKENMNKIKINKVMMENKAISVVISYRYLPCNRLVASLRAHSSVT